ncbi:MAG TPA: 16S rRNA (adenine(1518)-N(6)/adenine(1519)-N(6))-dimethyltransferase RsmA [Alphaproteobacteria bacterium]|nr:16S rRNA (adenine(1518)-N(6)/adenine(1519)-N(6))-dimethyltransferase [Rhodospirillaceae bacterium]HRJ12610.1 16S rRNA (adenine(1518)-N(6)/adenine(1519)-N(6))-dimethyltransferase RsmA [Alphaproteobacteria bacterium]
MTLAPLREVIAKHGLDARKGLGQNFILDLNITRKIVRGAGDLTGVHVIEIGPGPGGLTRAILESPAADVHVIELDSRAIGIMEELKQTAGDRLHITEGDALEFNYDHVPAPRAIIANLPYHVASQLLIGWLQRASDFQSITIMLQKEMAQRLAAKPRTPEYGRLSVMCQWLCDVKILFDVPGSAFVPPPKVTSSIVHLIPHLSPPDVDFKKMEKTVALAFSQRRKMLKGILNANSHNGEKLLSEIGVLPTARAEELTIQQFTALAKLL